MTTQKQPQLGQATACVTRVLEDKRKIRKRNRDKMC